MERGPTPPEPLPSVEAPPSQPASSPALKAHAEGEEWTADLARFLLGQIGEDELLARASAPEEEQKRRERQCEAHAYMALQAEREGDLSLVADHARACVKTDVTNYVEYAWATERLRQLGR